jgi:hypothetical protein
MWIEKVDGSCVYLSLDPETCLAIADACGRMGQHFDDCAAGAPVEHRLESAFYRALGSTFEGYALIGHAGGMITPDDEKMVTPATARQEWSVRARDRSSK